MPLPVSATSSSSTRAMHGCRSAASCSSRSPCRHRPPPGSCKSVPASANAAIGPLDVGTLSTGQHFLAMRGHGGGQWGLLGAPKAFQVIPGVAILLLNGYNPCGVGPHPEEWWQDPGLSPPIPRQVAAYAFNHTTSNARNLANPRAPAEPGPQVCVVDNPDARAQLPC